MRSVFFETLTKAVGTEPDPPKYGDNGLSSPLEGRPPCRPLESGGRFRGSPLYAGIALTCLCLNASPAFSADRVCLEAESCAQITAPMRVVNALDATNASTAVAGASGDKYLEIPKGAGHPPQVNEGDARLSFELEQDGDYILWCRAYWLSECNSSFTMAVDDALPFTFGKDATYNVWHWVKAPPRLKQLTLTKGKHVLTIKNRQDGVKLDQVLFVLDKRYVPVGIEELTPARPTP